MDLAGASRVVWTYQHVVGHHSHTNANLPVAPSDRLNPDAFDPDSGAGSPLIRLNPSQPYRWYHKYQHIYIWFLLPLVPSKWLVKDLLHVAKRKYMDIEFGAPRGELQLLLLMKVVFITYALIAPVYVHGSYGFVLFAASMIAKGYEITLTFGVNHMTDGCFFPDDNQPQDERDWAMLQVVTSSNFGVDSWWCTQLSGGANLQIEHHLFPSVNHLHLPAISPIIRQTCHEFRVPYLSFPTFRASVYAYYLHFKKLSEPPLVEAKLKSN